MARKYTEDELERGLFALAICGDGAAASRQLAAQGHKIPARTLTSWPIAHAERFREISAKHIQEVRDVIAQEQIEIAHAAGEAERVAIAKTKGQLEDGSVKDASTAGRNLAVQKGIALDHSLKMRGEPTVVHEHRQVEDILKRLHKLAPNVFHIEGEAEEIGQTPSERHAELPPALPNGNGNGTGTE
jgi:hypothetical protein